MIYVVATLIIRPGSLGAVMAAAKACIAETRKEKGCIAYDVNTSVSDPDTLVFVEKWERREDLTAHSRSPHLAAWREASNPHLVSKTVEVVHPERVETF